MNPATLPSLLPSALTVFASSTVPLVGFQSYTSNALNDHIDGETNALSEDFARDPAHPEEHLDARIQAVDDKVDALTSEVQFLKGQLPLSVPIQTSQTGP